MADASVISGVSTPEVSSQAKQVFPVYIIHSGWSLPDIDLFLEEYGGGEDGGAGFLRVVYDNEGRETKRTIAILSDNVYDALMKDGYDRRRHGKDFVLNPFELKDNNFPGTGRTSSLFVPVPKNLCAEDRMVVSAISDKLQHLSQWKILPEESWSVKPLLQSREKGGIKGGCFISFKKEVPLECRAMVRLLLTDTYWPETTSGEERAIFHCFWARLRNDFNEPKEDKPATEEEAKNAKEVKKERAIKNVVNKAVPLGGGKPLKDNRPFKENKPLKDNRAVKESRPVKEGKFVKEDKPVKGGQKKAPTVPLTQQPTLKEEKHSGLDNV